VGLRCISLFYEHSSLAISNFFAHQPPILSSPLKPVKIGIYGKYLESSQPMIPPEVWKQTLDMHRHCYCTSRTTCKNSHIQRHMFDLDASEIPKLICNSPLLGFSCSAGTRRRKPPDSFCAQGLACDTDSNRTLNIPKFLKSEQIRLIRCMMQRKVDPLDIEFSCPAKDHPPSGCLDAKYHIYPCGLAAPPYLFVFLLSTTPP
jgi:hypothetical protein